jgi:hypothetical protein
LCNRFRDFCLFCFLFFDGGAMLCISIIAKSSLLVFAHDCPTQWKAPLLSVLCCIRPP